jgi:hypothetical protein
METYVLHTSSPHYREANVVTSQTAMLRWLDGRADGRGLEAGAQPGEGLRGHATTRVRPVHSSTLLAW